MTYAELAKTIRQNLKIDLGLTRQDVSVVVRKNAIYATLVSGGLNYEAIEDVCKKGLAWDCNVYVQMPDGYLEAPAA